ncbi:ATP-binding protein [Cupriavidus sp. SIMBA_020]|uniref:sensor histidine kinase n=1 Tax=Cupriavidus sp. SIMBA_020 TaxID=3085766 RepID=UPI00397B7BBD
MYDRYHVRGSTRRYLAAALALLGALLVAPWVSAHDLELALAPRKGSQVIALSVACAGSMLLALICTLLMLRLKIAIGALAGQMASVSAAEIEGGDPLVEAGPLIVARLIRAINDAWRQCRERESELLTVQASFAHDLRTPLTRMLLRCDMIDNVQLRDAMERDLDEVRELAEAGLACARTQSGIAKVLESVDADSILGALVHNYRDAGCVLALEGNVGRPVVTCPHALRRLLGNLIDNAFRYGSVVRITVRVESRRLHLAVIDSGPGIAPSELDAVFKPWYRSPETIGRGPGSGLGLAIALRLSKAIRGELTLENRQEGGLEARLSLPL